MATRFYSSVEYGSSRANNDPDVIYFNGSLINNVSTNNTKVNQEDPQVVFNETRAAPILDDASEYMFSVIRFSLNGAGKSLPLWIPKIDDKQVSGFTGDLGDSNKTVYVLGMSADYYNGTTNTYKYATTPLTWYAENANAPPPETNLTTTPIAGVQNGQALNSTYYYGYTYTNFCYMVNQALKTVLTSILSQLAITFNAGGTPSTPFLRYDPVTKLFSFLMDSRYFGINNTSLASQGLPGVTSTLTLNIWLNDDLELLLSNFWIEYIPTLTGFIPSGGLESATPNLVVCGGYLPGTFNPNPPIEVAIDPTTGLPYSPTKGHTYWVITQNYQSTSGGWSPIDCVVMTTTQIPTVQEQTAAPQAVGSSDFGWGTVTSEPAFQRIIADYALEQTGAEDYRKFVEFVPTAEYRMISMSLSKSPIQTIDFQMWWRNRLDNNLYPLLLANGTSVAVKFMFRRKQLGV
jgi:hypothetical protein